MRNEKNRCASNWLRYLNNKKGEINRYREVNEMTIGIIVHIDCFCFMISPFN